MAQFASAAGNLSLAGAALACVFGNRSSPAELTAELTVTCRTPRLAPPGRVRLSLSLDGGSSAVTSFASFVYYDLSLPPQLDEVTPRYTSSLQGGEELTISGSNLPLAVEVCA